MGESPAYGVGWRELSKSECFGLLARGRVGRVAFVDDLGPMVMPVNLALDRHMVVFRTDGGTKLDAAVRGSRVAFEVDGIDEAARTGWSVVIRGEAVEVTDPVELARLRRLPLSPWAPGAKAHYVRILPAVLTGRRISATWPAGRDRTRTVAAARLAAELVPAARQGLVQAGVAAEEADGMLDVICARIATGQTGAAWQRAALAAAGQRHDRERALAVMLGRYLHHAETGLPVHTWPVAS